ncbi:Hypothetical protein NGAL_HAMBI1146_45130 [Neorhizobium galegae bv. officinalis]|nr:Hypothetical protein NGAL_HAMBI1146_45130 [Neorhizobium galegae bv. officinalis]
MIPDFNKSHDKYVVVALFEGNYEETMVADAQPAWNIAMAAPFFVMAPPAPVILLMQRWFTKGLVDSSK